MTGEILRLKSFRHYGRKLKRGQPGFVSAEMKAPVGKHVVVAVLAAVPEDMELSDDFVAERMKILGWIEDREE